MICHIITNHIPRNEKKFREGGKNMQCLLTSALFEGQMKPQFKPVNRKKREQMLNQYYTQLKEAGFEIEWKEHPTHGKYPFVRIKKVEDLQKLIEIVEHPIILTPEGELIIYDYYIEWAIT